MRTLTLLLGLALCAPASAQPDYASAPAPNTITFEGLGDAEKDHKAITAYVRKRLAGRATVTWKEGVVFTVLQQKKVTLAQLRAIVRGFAKKKKGLKIKDIELKGYCDLSIKLDKKPHPDKVFALTLQVQQLDGVTLQQGSPSRNFDRVSILGRAPGTSISEIDLAVVDALNLEPEDKKSVVAVVWNGPPKGKKKKR